MPNLVLMRDAGEALVFKTGAETIRVELSEVHGNKGKLYITASRNVEIMREEMIGNTGFRAAVEEKLRQPDPSRIFDQHLGRNGKVAAK